MELCVQTETDETLQCPARSSNLPDGSGYMSLAENLNQFKDLGIVPMDLDVEKLDEGIGIQETLMIHVPSGTKPAALNAINKLFSKYQKNKPSRGAKMLALLVYKHAQLSAIKQH